MLHSAPQSTGRRALPAGATTPQAGFWAFSLPLGADAGRTGSLQN